MAEKEAVFQSGIGMAGRGKEEFFLSSNVTKLRIAGPNLRLTLTEASITILITLVQSESATQNKEIVQF